MTSRSAIQRARSARVDGRRSRVGRRSARSPRGAHVDLRPRDRRRGPGPLADAAPDDRTARAQRVGHRARRPRAGNRGVDPHLVGRCGGAPADRRRHRTGRPDPGGWRSRDLTLGYRVPGLVLDFAAQLLPEAAPMVAVTESVRVGRRPPRLLPVADADLFPTAVAESAALAAEGFLVGCIVAGEHVAGAASAFGEQGVEFGTPERDGILKPITLLPALTAKGLEFDAVVVVEPAVIAGGTTRGPPPALRRAHPPDPTPERGARAGRCRTRCAPTSPLRR